MNDARTVIERLRAEADMSEKGTAFMGDADLIEETTADVALRREAATMLERAVTDLGRAVAALDDLQQAGHDGACVGCGKRVGGGFDGDHSPGCPISVAIAAAAGGAAQPKGGTDDR